MTPATYHIGDVHEHLARLEPDSVDLVMTSPPFLALRSYLPADHPDKALEIGSEATPGEFIDAMLDVVEACGRVLAPHGSLVFELGDTYAGGGGEYHRYDSGYSGHNVYPVVKNAEHPNPGGDKKGNGWPLDKSKVLIPQLFAISLAYGFNPLTGRQTEPWRVRNTVAWCRPNPPVGRDGDKFRPATSFLTVACKARDRYWDGDAVREENKPRGGPSTSRKPETVHDAYVDGGGNVRSGGGRGVRESMPMNPAGAPLLDWWSIPTQPYAGSHYATYPSALVVPIVKSMCPLRVCRECGQPSRRITENPNAGHGSNEWNRHGTNGPKNGVVHAVQDRPNMHESITLGWSDCHHNNWRTGTVLDPFAGSGTTLEVATGHGLHAIGIDLDPRNAHLAQDRIGGLLLTINAA